jgi:hypothetical protein
MVTNQNINKIESYLGKNINNIKKDVFLISSDSISSSNKTYTHDFKNNHVYFLKKKCRALFVGTNKQDIVTSVLLATEKKIDEEFYLLLVEKYGVSSQMQKMGKVKKESKKTIREHYSTDITVTEAINCSFNESPLNIKWNKSEFTINIKMDSIRNTSLISFELKK